jgi:hypothetical protein
MSELFSPARFILLPDDTNPDFIQCYCLSCNRLIAASREKMILEIVQRNHTCKTDDAVDLQSSTS